MIDILPRLKSWAFPLIFRKNLSIMTPTKDQQAWQYADKQLSDICLMLDYEENKQIGYFHTYDIQKAYIDGYTACEQSMWRSVEEELPEDMVNVLVHCSDADPELSDCIAYLKNMVWCFLDDFYIGCTVSHWMPIPPIPETNTEKK